MSVTSEITNPSLLNHLLTSNEEEEVQDDITMVSIRTPDDFSTTVGNNMISRCILTAFVPDTDPKWLQPTTWFEEKRIGLWCGQFEECPETERLHIHIYVEFKHQFRLRWNTIRNTIERVSGKPGNIAAAKKVSAKQRQGAVNYVLKPDRMFETEPFIWEHNKVEVCFKPDAVKKQKRSKTDEREEQVNWIESKPKHWTWEQIVHESRESKLLLAACSWGAKYHAGRHAENPRRTIDKVIVLYGAGGTGKTTLAMKYDTKQDEDFHERYFKRNADDGKFWGGGRTAYRGQRIIHLEEFCGQETAANLKQICEIGKNGPSVNIKNSGTELNHDTVIITSNHHPAGWYRNLFKDDPKQWAPIVRRFTQVWFFPEKREDGSPNVPDAENHPYYIDQTGEFLSHAMRDYEFAHEHAETWWPLPERTEPDAKRLKLGTEAGTYW